MIAPLKAKSVIRTRKLAVLNFERKNEILAIAGHKLLSLRAYSRDIRLPYSTLHRWQKDRAWESDCPNILDKKSTSQGPEPVYPECEREVLKLILEHREEGLSMYVLACTH
jgi:hypothetical protein